MPSNPDLLSVAFGHSQAGRADQAEQLCREVLATDQSCADAWHLLGLIASQVGDHAKAAQLLARAKELKPSDPEIHNNLGTALLQMGRFGESAQCHQAAIVIKPDAFQAHYNLALAFQCQGKRAEAIRHYRQAIALKHDFVAAYCNLGSVLKDDGKLDEAIGCYQHALSIDQNSAETHNNLGVALAGLRRFDEAAQSYRRAIELNPNYANPHHNLGVALQEQGLSNEAIKCFRRAVTLEPDYLDGLVSLGNALHELGQHEPAIASYRRALNINPSYADAVHNLAVIHLSQSRLAEADPCLATLLNENPKSADGWALLAQSQQMRARSTTAIESFQRAVSLKPTARLHSKLLMASQYATDPVPERLLASHREWDAIYARQFLPVATSSRLATGHLRIGFVSKDFKRHPIGFLALPVLEALDKFVCSIVCYSDSQIEDGFTARFHAVADTWRNVAYQTDEALAQQIRADQIDILVDLMGHTGDRLLTFAHKPAPVQMTWLGYVGTAGMAAIDYLLADRFHVRPGEEQHYSETILRMPHAYACYAPPTDAPPVGPLPALTNELITFGCFNNPAKYSPTILHAWAEILRRLPDSRLFLKYGGLDDPTLLAQLRREFHDRGIASEQLLLEGWSPSRELLAAYNRVDLALDTQPYSGGLTTCEALWMGVPIITFPGKTFAGRHATSYLSNTGLDDFIAADLNSYIDLALQWANRQGELAAIRSQLRDRFLHSPICNAPQFARDFLSALLAVC